MLLADTTIRDSLRAGGFKNLKETAEKYFEQNEGQNDNSDPNNPEKKRGILERLFGRKQEEAPKKEQQDQQ